MHFLMYDFGFKPFCMSDDFDFNSLSINLVSHVMTGCMTFAVELDLSETISMWIVTACTSFINNDSAGYVS